MENPPPRTGQRHPVQENVLAAMASVAWLSVADLRAMYPGYRSSDLKRCVDRMVARGMLEKRKSPRPRDGRGGHNANEYGMPQ